MIRPIPQAPVLQGVRLCLALAILLSAADMAVAETEFDVSGRYRYQAVNDAERGDAQASTLKLRVDGQWRPDEAWTAFAQLDHVEAFNEQGFNSVTFNPGTSPVPDPHGSEVNQLLLRYQSSSDWHMTLGRQALRFDNERHIGTIEFWQNDQTMDAVRFGYDDNIHWSASVVWVDKVHRIFGDDAGSTFSPNDVRFAPDATRPVSELGNHDHQSQLLNVAYQFDRQLKLVGYAYLLHNLSARIFSSDTFGVRLEGEVKPDTVKYGYNLEYARQSNRHDNPWQFDTDYRLLELSAQYRSHQIIFSYERLGADNGFGFATSLGTNHKFQGWADVFTSYNARGGLEDWHLTYRGRDGKLRWRVVLHQFEGIEEAVTAGHELDVEIAYRYDRKWEFKFIGAKYFADEGITRLAPSQQDLTTWMVSAAYNL